MFMFISLLTKLVSNCGSLSRVRWLANTGRIAAADTEAVGFSLCEIKQRKARRLYWDLRVHPLPAVCIGNTLLGKEENVTLSLKLRQCNNLICRKTETFS